MSCLFLFLFQSRGSTAAVLANLTFIVLVYLSFNFNIKIYRKLCGRWSDDCTCIEDRVERRLARSMGLKAGDGKDKSVELKVNDAS